MENIYAKQDLTSHELQLLASEMDRRKKSTATTWIESGVISELNLMSNARKKDALQQ
jgi:hypothetical protein